MNKSKKFRVKKMFVGSVVVTSVAGAVVSTVALSVEQGTRNNIVYEGTQFDSYEKVLNYLIKGKKINIDTEKVLGDIKGSYADSMKGQLNKAFLPTYDPSKIEFAWFGGSNQILRDKAAALQTYFNSGLVKTKWTDGNGNIFASQEEAESSRQRNFSFPYLGYYESIPFFGSNNSIVTSTSNRINPFSATDVARFENNLQNNIFTIIENTLFGQTDEKGGYSVAIDRSKLAPEQLAAFNADYVLDLTASSYDHIKADLGDKVSFSNNSVVGVQDAFYRLKWKSMDWIYDFLDKDNLGGYSPSDWKGYNSKYLDFNFGIHKDSNPQNPVVKAGALIGANQGFHVPKMMSDSNWYASDLFNPGTTIVYKEGIFTWVKDGASVKTVSHSIESPDNVASDFGKISVADLMKIINLETPFDGYNLIRSHAFKPDNGEAGDKLASSETSKILGVKAQDRLSIFDLERMYSEIKKLVADSFEKNKSKIVDEFFKEQSAPIFLKGSNGLATHYRESLMSQKNVWIAPNNNGSRYELEDFLPPTDPDLFDASLVNFEHSGSKFKINGVNKDSKIKGHIAFKVNELASDKIVGVDWTNSDTRLLSNTLWNWKDTATKIPLVIKKNNHPIFTVSLKTDQNGKPVINLEDWKNVSLRSEVNAKTDLARLIQMFDGINPFNGIFDNSPDILERLRNMMNQFRAGNVPESDKFLLSPQQLPNFDAGYSYSEGIKQFMYFFMEAYAKLKEGDLNELGLLRSNIPSTEKMLYLGENNDQNFHIGLYSLRNFSYFNPSLSIGGKVTGDLFGTSAFLATEIKNREFVTNASSVLVAYDFNGKIVNYDSMFDDEYVIKANFLNKISPRRDYDHVFVQGRQEKVVNRINTIYKVSLVDDTVYYFDTHKNLYDYLLEYVENLVINSNK